MSRSTAPHLTTSAVGPCPASPPPHPPHPSEIPQPPVQPARQVEDPELEETDPGPELEDGQPDRPQAPPLPLPDVSELPRLVPVPPPNPPPFQRQAARFGHVPARLSPLQRAWVSSEIPGAVRIVGLLLALLSGALPGCASLPAPMSPPKVQMLGPGSYKVLLSYTGQHIHQAEQLLQQYGAEEGERLGCEHPALRLDPSETKEGPPPPAPKKEPKDGEEPPPSAITIVSGFVACLAAGNSAGGAL